MSDKLGSIIHSVENQIRSYEGVLSRLLNEMEFLQKHGFEEELLVKTLKYDELSDVVRKWRSMYDRYEYE